MSYTNNKDWCDDCCWEFGPDRKGWYKQMHTYPCDCVCHHPTRVVEALKQMENQLLVGVTNPVPSSSFDYPWDW